MLPGGGGFTKQTTGLKCNIPNIFDIVGSIGVKTKDLDQVMYHPFMIKTKIGYKLISGSMISSFLFYKIDKNGNYSKLFPPDIQQAIHNDDYHHIFHKLNFYVLEAVKQGAMIKGKNLLNPESYRKFVKSNEYSYVLDYLDDKAIEIVSFKPGYHYLLGGIQVDNNLCSVSNPDVFALGESVANFYSPTRPGGMGHTDSIVLAGYLGKVILNR